MEREFNNINEKLQDALSLIIILENDLQSQKVDEVYQLMVTQSSQLLMVQEQNS